MGGKRLFETVSCLSFIYFCCTIIIFITLTPSTVSAQAAVEYGTIIGSKTPPKTPNVMKSSEKISQKESSKASPKNGSKEKTSNQVKKTGAKGSGPVIIEKRGNSYERIN
jgi:hypothetical protein